MLTMQMKRVFFDRRPVVRAVDKAKRRELARAGAYVRKGAQFSIRRRKGPSAAGQPPHSHVGLLRRLIFFGWDREADGVVVGPTLLKAGSDVPETLEKGGRVLRRTRRLDRRGRRREGRRRRCRYPARPFMWPALVKAAPKLPRRWRNAIRQGA